MKSGDKVVCIDATPLPNYAPRDCELGEFEFPDGFIEEGTTYHVTSVVRNGPTVFGLFLTGKRVLFRRKEVSWCSARFRKIDEIERPLEVREAIEEAEPAELPLEPANPSD